MADQVSARTANLEEANRALVRDMEERQRLEEQLLQVQKLESVGTLAGGISHDFNNILNIMQGYAFILKDYAAKNEEIAEPVEAIEECVQRGAAVVRQLLTLARKTATKFERIAVRSVFNSLSTMLKEAFPKTIEVTMNASDLPPVMADANQLLQVLLNLCINARDAMPEGGNLTIEADAADSGSLENLGPVPPGKYVRIQVTDTGTGMDQRVQGRIFEPFFTTKGVGKGTGLGLAVAYGIVKSHKGYIQVESKQNHGTTFRLYFPAVP